MSPDGQDLAGIQGVGWSPGGTTSFNMHKLVLLNLVGGEESVLYEIATHPNGWLASKRSALAQLAWSPNSQKIAFIEGFLNRDYRVKIIDVRTGEVENLGLSGAGGLFPTWSPDSSLLVMAVADETGSMFAIDILSANGTLSQKNLAGSWGVIDGIDWSPDGKTIVFAASEDSSPERLELYWLNIETKELAKLPLDENLSYENPQWSPDGNMIAMNARPTRANWVDKLLVYNVAAQKIVATVEGQRFSQNFYWSDDSQTILLTKGFPPDTRQTIELFYWQENRTEVIPFPEGIEDGVAIGIWSE